MGIFLSRNIEQPVSSGIIPGNPSNEKIERTFEVTLLYLEKLLRRHVIGDLARLILDYMDVEMRLLQQWIQKSGKPLSRIPDGIAVLSGEGKTEVFATDGESDLVQVFSTEGKLLREWGRSGERRGEFLTPCGVAILPSGERREIAVIDWGATIESRFTPPRGSSFDNGVNVEVVKASSMIR